MKIATAILAFLAFCAASQADPLPSSPLADAVIGTQTEMLAKALAPLHATVGSPVFLRVFKEERQLELWVTSGTDYRLFKTYPICAMSGQLGPKLRVGDGQAPEGFYEVSGNSLNPYSSYHLAMNVGYPNAYDRANRHTGAMIMIYGSCVSIGCFAMTDAGVEEIYTMVDSAIQSGEQTVPVHIYPFRMTAENLGRHARDKWFAFWRELKPAYDAFEANHQPPAIAVANARYSIQQIASEQTTARAQ